MSQVLLCSQVRNHNFLQPSQYYPSIMYPSYFGSHCTSSQAPSATLASFSSICTEQPSLSTSSFFTANSLASEKPTLVCPKHSCNTLPYTIEFDQHKPCHVVSINSSNSFNAENFAQTTNTPNIVKHKQIPPRVASTKHENGNLRSSKQNANLNTCSNYNWLPNETKQRLTPSDSTKTKFKTQLCKTFMAGKICRFGDGCHFAHGDEELQCKTLFEADKAGLLDKRTFCTRPCFDWVSTGSCPFHDQCNSIHDPRISSTEKAWLDKIKRPHHRWKTSVHVDNAHHLRLCEVHHNSSLGKNILPLTILPVLDDIATNGFEIENDLKYQCSEQRWLEISNKMQPVLGKIYVHKPDHKIICTKNGEVPCTLLNVRAFKIPAKAHEPISDIPIEEYHNIYNSHDDGQESHTTFSHQTNGIIPQYVLVNEIAFSSYGELETSVCLILNLPNDALVKCNIHESRELTKKAKLNHRSKLPSFVENFYQTKKQFYFNNSNLYQLHIKTHNHRLREIMLCRNNNLSLDKIDNASHHDRWLFSSPAFSKLSGKDKIFPAGELRSKIESTNVIMIKKNCSILAVEKLSIQSEHANLYSYLSSVSWPMNKLRDTIAEDLPTPSVLTKYCIESNDNISSSQIWESFISTNKEEKNNEISTIFHQGAIHSQLPIFESLKNSTQTTCQSSSLSYIGNDEHFWNNLYYEWDVVKDSLQGQRKGVHL